jgi:hypothetical protein
VKYPCLKLLVADSLWRALHDLCMLQLAGFSPRFSAASLDAAWRGHSEDTLLFVTHTLRALGCPLALESDAEPRSLFVALIWALHRVEALQHALRRSLQDRFVTPALAHVLLPPYPADLSQTPECTEAGAAREQAALAFIADAAAIRARNGEHSALREHVVLLQGRVLSLQRQLSTALQASATRLARLRDLQPSAGLPPYSPPLTPVELRCSTATNTLERVVG